MEQKAQGGEFMSRNPRGRNSMSSPKAVGWMTERKLTPLSLIPGNLEVIDPFVMLLSSFKESNRWR